MEKYLNAHIVDFNFYIYKVNKILQIYIGLQDLLFTNFKF